MFSDYRLGPLLWATGFVLFGLLLLLVNTEQLAAGEPIVRLVLASTLAAAAAGFFLGYFAARREWSRLIPAWTLLALAAMVAVSGYGDLDARVTASILFFGLAVAFGNIYGLNRQANWWALIPAGFMLVLGIVIALSSFIGRLETLGALLFAGLGLVFIFLYWLGGRSDMWWALVPGAVLTIFGFAVFTTGTEGQSTALRWWPVLLIVLGLVIGAIGTRRRPTERMEVNARAERRPVNDSAAGGDEGRAQLGEYARPAPGATVEILPEHEPDSR